MNCLGHTKARLEYNVKPHELDMYLLWMCLQFLSLYQQSTVPTPTTNFILLSNNQWRNWYYVKDLWGDKFYLHNLSSLKVDKNQVLLHNFSFRWLSQVVGLRNWRHQIYPRRGHARCTLVTCNHCISQRKHLSAWKDCKAYETYKTVNHGNPNLQCPNNCTSVCLTLIPSE